MKKLITAICVFFVLSVSAFCEAGVKLDLGAGLDVSLSLKPYIYLNAGAEYEFESGFRLGGGARGDFNVLHKQYESGSTLNSESWVYGIPYILIGYKGFSVEGGFSFSSDVSNPFEIPYIRLGGDLVFSETEKGTLGMELGAEFWPSLYLVAPEDNSTNAQVGAGLGSFFLTLGNMFKLSAGFKYRLSF